MITNVKKSFNIFAIAALLLMLVLPYVTTVNAATITGSSDDYSLTIFKYKQDPLDPDNPAGTGEEGQTPTGTAMENVTFEITQTHAYDPTTDAWTEVTNGTPIQKVTNASGEALFTAADGLKLGRYAVKEVVTETSPKDIVPNTETFYVDIPMTSANGTKLNYKVAIYPKNEMLRGAVELIKTGENNIALAGAQFDLFKKGTTTAEDKKINTAPLVTDTNGKLYVNGLEYGDYYFVETKAPAGHLLDTTPVDFEIEQDGSITVEGVKTGTVVETAMQNFNKPTIEKDVEGKTHHDVNRDTEYTYNLTLPLPGNIKEYKEYKVTDILDMRLTYAGTWTIKGTDSSNIEFTTSTTATGNEVLQWSVKDLTLLTPNTDLVISFTSKIKPGAVLNPEETGIPNYAILEFDNNHGVVTKPVDPNNPPGPEDPTNPPTDPEDPTDPPTTPPVTVKPTEGGLKVIKVDASDNNIKLEGAEFKLTTDKEGKNIVQANGIIKINSAVATGALEKLITNADGEFLIEGLAAGTYYLHETKAPTYTNADGETKSYRLLTSPEEVTIAGDSSNTEVIVENSKSAWYLPQTGGLGTILFTVIGLTLMGLALIVLRRNKQQTA